MFVARVFFSESIYGRLNPHVEEVNICGQDCQEQRTASYNPEAIDHVF